MTILIISRESAARAEITVIFYVNRRKSILGKCLEHARIIVTFSITDVSFTVDITSSRGTIVDYTRFSVTTTRFTADVINQ